MFSFRDLNQHPANIYLLKVNKRNTSKRYEICSSTCFNFTYFIPFSSSITLPQKPLPFSEWMLQYSISSQPIINFFYSTCEKKCLKEKLRCVRIIPTI